ncbi:MAG TPA: 50S ribosomal protein L4, partial [Planctomycetaceae bacterium]|nr:50S ribosomal protein L4 [Planctomycetaceae bacterium]
TKKMYRQKGTGNARAGSKRSPIRRGGGHTFAKTTRDWSYRLPKKAIRLATRMALLSKFEDEQVRLVDDIQFDSPKTKSVVTMLSGLGLDPSKTLVATQDYNVNFWKSARNIAGLRVSPAAGLNAYDLLHQRMLVVTKSALDSLRNVESENS